MKLPTSPPGLVGKIVKYRPLSEPINQVMDARLKFGQHKKSVRVAPDVAESNSSFSSALLTFRVHL